MIEKEVRFDSQIGPLYVRANKRGVTGILWQQKAEQLFSRDDESIEVVNINKAIVQLEEYFMRERKVFDVPMDLQGTTFQKQVWKALLKIPYGETCSYSVIASEINNQKAVRAVGAANGKNPISIIIPCHRVVGKNGTLTGYAGGLSIKEKLLSLEKNIF